jgi:hypothetical protein
MLTETQAQLCLLRRRARYYELELRALEGEESLSVLSEADRIMMYLGDVMNQIDALGGAGDYGFVN